MKFKLLFLLTLFCAGAMDVLAQTHVTGTVISADDKEPVIGASVVVSGTKTATVTDYDGKFSITVPSGKKLQFSYVGYKTVTLNPKAKMEVYLETDANQVDEVIVTGMQKMDKRLFTGASTKVDAEKAKLDGVADISRSLEGRAAGVSVQNVSGTFGTAPKIRVRGATSIYGSSKPLWVVDGVIMEDVVEVEADALSSGDANTLISSAIAGLNADDIESFQILKDGSATSIYGARAMAGVIVVTTKKGKSGQNRISYTGEFTMRLKPSYSQFNIMNSQDQMSVYKEMYNSGFFSFARSYRASSSGVFGKMYHLMNEYNPETGFGLPNTEEAMASYLKEAEYRNTDWFDLLFKNSIQQNHSVSMSTGTDKAQYYTSFSIMDDPGWTKSSNVNRYTMNMNANFNLNKKVSVNLIGNASYRKQKAPGTSNRSVDPYYGTVSRDFDINPYSYALNTSRTLDPDEFYIRNNSAFNIFHELDNNYMELDVVDMKYQGEVKYKPVRTVELSAIAAYKFSTTTRATKITEHSNQALAFRAMDDATMRDSNPWLYTDPDVVNSLPITVLPSGGFYNENKNKMNSWDFRATAQYNDVFGEDTHIVNLYGGMEVNDIVRNASAFQGVGMQYGMGMLADYDYHYFKQAIEENNIYYGVGNTYSREVSFFGTGTYSYKGRYTINGTMRYEGSNRLGKATSARWLPTWNVSGAWNAHEEPWFWETFSNVLTHATLKASYSLTGDKPAVTNAQVIISSYTPWRPYSEDREAGLTISQFANEALTYEKKHELNLGVDLGFFNNRINVAFDWYKRNNYDLIGPKRTTGEGGTILKYANVASMASNGEELSISTKNIVNKNFSWTTDFIFSHTKSEVTELDAENRIIDMITGSGFTTKGYPYRSLFSIDFQGLNSSGLPTFINESGEKTVSDLYFQSYDISHLVYEGPTDPTITGSFGNIFRYKGLNLNVFITYSGGNVVRLDPTFAAAYSDLTAMPKEFRNRWTIPGDEAYTDIPAIADLRQIQNDTQLSFAYNAYNYSTARTASGNFVRMKEISLGYEFPTTWAQHLGVNSLSAKLQGTNLFLIYADKKLNGQDPEFFNSGGVAVPMARQFTFTLRVGI